MVFKLFFNSKIDKDNYLFNFINYSFLPEG